MSKVYLIVEEKIEGLCAKEAHVLDHMHYVVNQFHEQWSSFYNAHVGKV